MLNKQEKDWTIMNDLDLPMPEDEVLATAFGIHFLPSSPWTSYFIDIEKRIALVELCNRLPCIEDTAEACLTPEVPLLAAMRLNDVEIYQTIEESIGYDSLRLTLTFANTSNFDGPSWSYWNYRLGLPSDQRPPGLPPPTEQK